MVLVLADSLVEATELKDELEDTEAKVPELEMEDVPVVVTELDETVDAELTDEEEIELAGIDELAWLEDEEDVDDTTATVLALATCEASESWMTEMAEESIQFVFDVATEAGAFAKTWSAVNWDSWSMLKLVTYEALAAELAE